MQNKIKTIIKQFIPPIFLTLLRKIRSTSKYGWHGDYASWQEAQSKSTGYDAQIILEKVKDSLLKVKNGSAVYERDSVVFDEIQYSWLLLTGLMYAAAQNNGQLSVLDFGGSLGSSYYQNKKFLDGLESVTWSIVEQPNFVECGKTNFADGVLKFYDDVNQCLVEQSPNVLILSSVLQYIEKPYVLLEKLLEYKFDMIIIDRTPFSRTSKDIITIQRVPPSIYPASYPCWLLSEPKLINKLHSNGYKLIESELSDLSIIVSKSIFKKFKIDYYCLIFIKA